MGDRSARAIGAVVAGVVATACTLRLSSGPEWPTMILAGYGWLVAFALFASLGNSGSPRWVRALHVHRAEAAFVAGVVLLFGSSSGADDVFQVIATALVASALIESIRVTRNPGR